MSSLSDDLEGYIEKIRNSFYEQNANQISENDMWNLIENLIREVEISKEHAEGLEKSLKLCLQDDSVNINVKYISLKEKWENIQKENTDLKTQLEAEKLECSRKITESEECYNREITELKIRIESDKASHKAKEERLYNELQLAQASTALQCDEIESHWKRQIVDANSKLRQSQNLVRNLQVELSNLKMNQLAIQHTPAIQRLPKSDLKYQPLSFATHNPSGDETEEADFVEPRAPTPVNRGGPHFVFKGVNMPRKKNSLPPLRPCTSPTTSISKTKNYSKKRKLYNPDDMAYLQDIQEED